MSHDAFNCFSENQSVVGTSTTVVSTNVIDLGAGKDGLQAMSIAAKVRTAYTGSGILQAVLQDSADNSSFADVLAGVAIAGASLIAGKKIFNSELPANLRRYIRMSYVITSAALATGTIDANLQENPSTGN